MAKITNNLLLTIIIALITWSWVSYITNWQLLAISASIATSALFICLACKSTTSTSKVQPLTDSLAIHLAVSPNSTDLIDSMLQYYLYDTTMLDKQYLLATKDDTTHLVYCHNSSDSVTSIHTSCMAQLCLLHGITHAVIIAPIIDIKATAPLSYYNITLNHINIPSLYSQLQHANMLPDLHTINTKNKSIVASYALSAHRAKHYALSSIFLLVFSWWSYIPTYTLAWATALLLLAIYSKFNRRYNTKISPNLKL